MNTQSNPGIDAVEEIVKEDIGYVWHRILQHKVYETSEPIIKDVRGKEYFDATAGGVWCDNAGFGRESIARVASEQLTTMPYFAGKFGNSPTIKRAKKLV